MTLYSPTRTSDGEGGFTTTLSGGTTVWGLVEVHEAERRLVVRQELNISPEDVLLVDGQYYRVVGRTGHVRGPRVAYDLEAIEKPITP